jgi:hypothetical protein
MLAVELAVATASLSGLAADLLAPLLFVDKCPLQTL